MTEPKLEANDHQSQRETLIRDKIAKSWGSLVGAHGYGEPQAAAGLLYDSLYRSGAVGDQLPPDERETTVAILEQPVDLEGDMPDRDEFVQAVADTMVRGVSVAETLLPGAREQIETLAGRGDEVIIWSAGDPAHQHHKLGAIGLHDPDVTPNVEPPVRLNPDFEPLEIQTAIATNKSTPENFDRVREAATGRQVVVVDDRAKNILKFLEEFPDAKGIWVQFGVHAKRALAKQASGEATDVVDAIAQGRIFPVGAVDQTVASIDSMYEAGVLDSAKELAVAFDYDDTIIDNIRRRDLQHAAVERVLRTQGWI
ncbi:MAG TPA: hypothetical protein VMT30_07745 [Candidatus Saccharimonadia bacterium]|nr:hypothetical protein [Candidatus Saccharimonadia bacterium]